MENRCHIVRWPLGHLVRSKLTEAYDRKWTLDGEKLQRAFVRKIANPAPLSADRLDAREKKIGLNVLKFREIFTPYLLEYMIFKTNESVYF